MSVSDYPNLTLEPDCKTVEEWVALAVGPSDHRHGFCRYLIVSDGFMYATDGYRMHIGRTEWKDGAYNPSTGKRVRFLTDIDLIKSVIPQVSSDELLPLEIFPCLLIESESNNGEPVWAFDYGGVVINEHYITQACADVVRFPKDREALYGCGKWGEFVIMPIFER